MSDGVPDGSPERTGRVDVVVVGGGPAGTACAIQCAMAGLRVALIEKLAFPRDHAGETLHPGAEPLLERLGVLESVRAQNFLRHEGHYVTWGETDRFVAYGADNSGPWRGFQVWRADFDTILLDRARAMGVDIRQPCRPLHPIYSSSGHTKDAIGTVSKGRLDGIATSLGEIRARFVVDASGHSHWLARHLDLPGEQHSPKLMASYGYATGPVPDALRSGPRLYADSRGWTWESQVRDNTCVWVRLEIPPLRHGEQPAGAITEETPEAIPEGVREMAPLGRVHRADVTWRFVPACAGPGYFLVGDAACVLDPTSSHGVLKALMSGMAAGDFISRVSLGLLSTDQAALCYRDFIARWFAHDVQVMDGLYKDAFPEWPGQAGEKDSGNPKTLGIIP